MKYRVFSYAVPCDEELTELNSFLSSHRILQVSDYLAADSRCLVFVVEYLDGAQKTGSSKSVPRVDYREQLTEAEFAVFSQLRDWRKRVANEESIPVYNIFTNAQLAEVVQKHIIDKTGLETVSGVGKSRIEKYSDRLLAVCRDLMASRQDKSDET